MIKRLIKLANELDSKGLRKEADYVDQIILKIAADEKYKIRDIYTAGAIAKAEKKRLRLHQELNQQHTKLLMKYIKLYGKEIKICHMKNI